MGGNGMEEQMRRCMREGVRYVREQEEGREGKEN